MSGASSGTGIGPSSSSTPAPKILLAKPAGPSGGVPAAKLARSGDDESYARLKLPPGSLNLLSDSWEFQTDRFLPLMSDNSEFTVIGIIGPAGVGKSTIMNELAGYDAGMLGSLPIFPVQTEEIKATARHCTIGIEARVTSDRLILLDAQPVFSPSVLADMMRPDGSSAVSVLAGESLTAELAHELMSIQLGVFLASVCNTVLVVSEGVHDISLWHLMLTVELLKQGIRDPSTTVGAMISSQGSSSSAEENKGSLWDGSAEFLADLLFVHSKLRFLDLAPKTRRMLKNGVSRYFSSSSFRIGESSSKTDASKQEISGAIDSHVFFLPLKVQEDSPKVEYESYTSMLSMLRDQVLGMRGRPFKKTVSERDWLRNSARIWEVVKKSAVIADYGRALQRSGLFRR